MNRKGVILSVYIYVLLIFFLLVLGSVLVVLNNTRVLSEKIKESANNKADDTLYGFSIQLEGSDTICSILGDTYVEPGFSAVDDNGNSLNVVVDSNLDIWRNGTYTIKYITRHNNKEKIVTREVVVYTPDFEYTGDYQTFNVMCDGIYEVELWGAEGGGTGGKGAYTKGEIYLSKGTQLYVYVGEAGSLGTFGVNATTTVGQGASATYNGGGAGGDAGGGAYPYANYRGGSSGGGATDIRLTLGDYDNNLSLRSRIMVAGGGGGTNSSNVDFDDNGSNGGKLMGDWGGLTSTVPTTFTYKRGLGGTQISGNSFGIGGSGDDSGITNACNGHSGGGGGYYGGTGGLNTGGSCYMIGGGGGSSYVSGYYGTNSINVNGSHTNSPIHYSNMKFNNIVILDGSMSMPDPDGSTETGHSGDGYAKITYLGTQTDVENSIYNMKEFIAVPSVTGVNIKAQFPDNTTSTMVRRKTTPWVSTDTTATGTLVSASIAESITDNSWVSDSVTTGTTYYYKAFPLIDGDYLYLPYQNESKVVAGGLYAEYTFEGNLNDTSSNGYNSTGSASIAYDNSPIGNALVLNGTSAYTFVPAILDSGTYSVSTWFYMNSASPASIGTIVSTDEAGGYYLYQGIGSNTYTLGVYFGGGYQTLTGPSSINGEWVHVVFVVNTTSGYVKIYHNGVLYQYRQYSTSYGASTLSGGDRGTCIGCNPGTSSSRTEFFNGKINQVRFYNREITSDEALSLYYE